MIQFNKQKIMQPNIAIHCDTEEKANELLKWAYNEGIVDDSYIEDNNCWYVNKENTCYDLTNRAYDSIKLSNQNNYTVLKYEDVLLNSAYISITDENGKEYKFKKPEWWNEKCYLLKVVNDQEGIEGIVRIFGLVNNGDYYISVSWSTNGVAYDGVDTFINELDLTPYKSEQDKFHEAINNGGVLCECWRNESPEKTDIVFVDNYNPNEYMSHDTVYHNARPLTKEEVEKYIFKG